MEEYVGILSQVGLSSSDIKRNLVLFDRIAIPQREGIDWPWRERNPELAANLDWLSERGLVFKVFASWKFMRPVPSFGLSPFEDGIDAKLRRNWVDALVELSCRGEAAVLRASRNDIEAVSLAPSVELTREALKLPKLKQTTDWLRIAPSKEEVLRVLIKEMPTPSETTSFDDIISFRDDPDTKRRMFAFRIWVRSLVREKEQVTPKQAVEQFEEAKFAYEEHMRIHRMKFDQGIVESLVTTAADVCENLVKLRWGKLAKLPFSLRHKKMDLLEAEANAPGHEISYVVRAREELSC